MPPGLRSGNRYDEVDRGTATINHRTKKISVNEYGGRVSSDALTRFKQLYPGYSVKAEAFDTAHALDTAPASLKPGGKLKVDGKLLTAAKVTTGTEDLFGKPTVQVTFTNGHIEPYRADGDLRVRAEDADGDPLTFIHVEWRKEEDKPIGDRRRRVVRVCAAYQGSDGYEYRKLFEAYGEPTVPKQGTHKELNAAKEQWRTTAHDSDQAGPGLEWQGLQVVVESPKGTERNGATMPADYGYINGFYKGADGDRVDCYLAGDEPWAYVVDQLTADQTAFDEHKCVLGAANEKAARKLYIAGHTRGKVLLGAITAMPAEVFKAWLKAGDTTQPVAWRAK